MSEENKKVSRKKFRLDLLSENSQDLWDEVTESIRNPTTIKTMEKICAIAYRKIRKPEAPRSMIAPNCGYCIWHPEYGDICVYGLPKPLRIALVKHRKLRYFDCELCAILDVKREEAKQLQKQDMKELKKHAIKELKKDSATIKFKSAYKVARDSILYALKYRTLKPAELSKHIFEMTTKEVSPESITMWYKRHPDIHEELKRALEGDREVAKKLRDSVEKKKKKYRTPQEMLEDYAR